uniref:Protein Skeletor n=1 Tax=Strigamia maritima TaxID=126957 RepID=T1ISN1_STRMM
MSRKFLCSELLCFVITTGVLVVNSQQKDIYYGQYLNKFNTYHTQILGDVYIVDTYTIFIKGFTYAGQSRDAYFMIGDSLRPNNEGIVVPNEEGKTNVLTQYINRDITLKLPKRVTEISWLAIYDIFNMKLLADVSIPEGFEPPSFQTIKPILGVSNAVSSDPVVVIDSKSLKIPNFSYDGAGLEVYFWIGKGAQPNKEGKKIPDENGYLSPIGAYKDMTIILEFPGNLTVNDNNWLSIWDAAKGKSYGSVFFPSELNIPPALVHILPHENRLPNCEQLHKDLQISWEVFGQHITIELAGIIGENDYMAFGISGSPTSSQMVGADVAISYIKGWQGLTIDYTAMEKAPCTKTVETFHGTCPDLQIGGLDDFQFIMHERKDNVTIINYRRSLQSADPKDINYNDTDIDTYVVWAVGHLSPKKEPLFHYMYPKSNVKINFGRKPPAKNCNYFVSRMKTLDTIEPLKWEPMKILDKSMRNLTATLGPSAGVIGYESFTGQPSQQLAWYINGLLAPEIYVKRNVKYTFIVEGGNDIHSALYNNPFYISNDPEGGHNRLTSNEQKQSISHITRHFQYLEKETLQFLLQYCKRSFTFAAGHLCRWENKNVDLRLLNQFKSFSRFRNKLRLICDTGSPGILEWIPNKTTPNTVYYQSYTQQNMGWKIHVLDEFPDSSNAPAFKSNQNDLLIPILRLVSSLSPHVLNDELLQI